MYIYIYIYVYYAYAYTDADISIHDIHTFTQACTCKRVSVFVCCKGIQAALRFVPDTFMSCPWGPQAVWRSKAPQLRRGMISTLVCHFRLMRMVGRFGLRVVDKIITCGSFSPGAKRWLLEVRSEGLHRSGNGISHRSICDETDILWV